MEADSWSRVAAPSKRHQNSLQSRFDLYMGFEEVEGREDEAWAEFPCPFCAEEFDMVGLCCHIDDKHPVEAKNGVCPACEERVGMDLLGHITMLHANYYKMQCRRRLRKGSSVSHSMLSLLKKELREGHLQTLLGGSSHTFPANAAPDPLLSSFMYNFTVTDSLKDAQPQTSDEGSALSKIFDNNVVESVEPSLTEKDQEENARRSEFVQELVLSTIFKDVL